MRRESLGEKITPILVEIEGCLLDSYGTPPEFPDEGINAATYIFVSALMDRMWVKMMEAGLDIETAGDLATAAGVDIRALYKKYTGEEPTSYPDRCKNNN